MTEMLGSAVAAEMGGVAPGVRATPAYQPTPNSEPTGALSGAPPHSRFYNAQVIPASVLGNKNNQPTQVAQATRENRIVFITTPAVGFTIFVGDTGVSPARGMALLPGSVTECVLPGGQDLYACTDAPSFITVQIQTSIVLAAERERRA